MSSEMKCAAAAIIALFTFVTVVTAETAALRMRFVLDGSVPVPKQIHVAPGFAPAVGAIVDETLLVDPKSNGIRNVVVHVDTEHREALRALPPREPRNLRVTIVNGRFEPHVLLAQVGDSLELINRDPRQHCPIINFVRNSSISSVLRPNARNVVRLVEREPTLIPIKCNIDPWMESHLVVLDHCFACVSDVEGRVVIDDLPANSKLVFRVLHGGGSMKNVKVDGNSTYWKRSRFEHTMTPGLNDLGEILVPITAFGF